VRNRIGDRNREPVTVYTALTLPDVAVGLPPDGAATVAVAMAVGGCSGVYSLEDARQAGVSAWIRSFRVRG
jgi:hypothetical protein